MGILSEQVAGYLPDLRPERSPLMAEMEAVAARDHVPIVHWETGRFLATLGRALDPERALGGGTAGGAANPAPRARPRAGAPGRPRERLLNAAHGGGARPRKDRHDRARSGQGASGEGVS